MSITKKEMLEYLKNHFRYNTMNSWNCSTSYAAKVKIHDFVPDELQDTAYEMLNISEVYDEIRDAFDDFARCYNYGYQMTFNGRSGGYIVMIHGGMRPSEDKTRQQIYTQPGKSIDFLDNLEDMDGDRNLNKVSKNEVKYYYDIVRHFDKIVERAKQIFLDYCKQFDVVDEEVLVPKTVKVLKEKAA